MSDANSLREPGSRQVGVQAPMPGVVYPPQADLERYVTAGALGYETLADGFRAAAQRHPEHIALLGPAVRITYRQLDELTDRLGAALLTLGLAPLDRVIFQLGDSEQLVMCFLACLKAGLIPVCTLYAHREQEIGYLADLAAARLHIVQGDDARFDAVAFAQKMQGRVASLRYVLQARGEPTPGAVLLDALIEGMDLARAKAILSQVSLDPFQVAVFQLSGGTTGVPKIIPRLHNEYLYNMRAVAAWLDFRADDVLFMPQPMIHNLNMGCCFGPFLMTGGTVTVAPNLQAETLVSMIETLRPSWLFLGGPIVARIDHAIKSGRISIAGARGVLAANSAKKLRELFGVRVHQVFGITEGVIMFTHRDDPQEALDITNGRPVSAWDEVKILKPGTEQLAAMGELGEPAFKGPYTTHGYYKAPERNRETFTSDGFYLSGDLMYERVIDGKTYYMFCGRLKDLVSRGGEKINCEEVEMAVAGHPAVAAVACVGYPDPIFDERLCALLIIRERFVAPNVRELGQYLESYGLAKFKWPERVEVVEAFPLSASGKLNKATLRDLVQQRMAMSAA